MVKQHTLNLFIKPRGFCFRIQSFHVVQRNRYIYKTPLASICRRTFKGIFDFPYTTKTFRFCPFGCFDLLYHETESYNSHDKENNNKNRNNYIRIFKNLHSPNSHFYFSKIGYSFVPDVCLSPKSFAIFIHFSMSFFAILFLRKISFTKKNGLNTSIAL